MDLMRSDVMFVNLLDGTAVVDSFAKPSVVEAIDSDTVDVDLPLAVPFVDYRSPCYFSVRTDCIQSLDLTHSN